MSESTGPSLEVLDFAPPPVDFRQEILRGLQRKPQKTTPAMYLYDERGSELFERITELEEYYLTRTEQAIMWKAAGDIRRRLGPQCLVIEYGSGNSAKTRRLLDCLDEPAGYVPLDISRDFLLKSAEDLAADYPELEVAPVCADFLGEFEVPDTSVTPRRRVVFFPGSTIGNFSPKAAVRCMRGIAQRCGPEGGALIGVDLKKDVAVLRPAYDDAEGVSAAFNLNILRRINCELGADFDLHAFVHQIRYNEVESRIEMHIESLEDQVVYVGRTAIAFRKGETIHTESSYKYDLATFARVAGEAGLKVERVWTDERKWFSVQYLSVC